MIGPTTRVETLECEICGGDVVNIHVHSVTIACPGGKRFQWLVCKGCADEVRHRVGEIREENGT